MCFNDKVSLFTFALGTTFSLLLIFKGNQKYKPENITSGIFFIFISLIQFMDFLFWIDLNNEMGINKITTILGPVLNAFQPVILYLIKVFYYKPDLISMKNFNLPFLIINTVYTLFFAKGYFNFLNTSKLTTGTSHGHLKWPWVEYFNPYLYLIVLALNIFYMFDLKYATTLFTITYAFLGLSATYFNYNIGELWCFFGSFIPFIFYFLSFYF
jgi:hypothetical protein